MSARNEAIVREFLEAIHASANPDCDKLQSYFTPDAVYHALVPASRIERGSAAIHQALEKQFKTYTNCNIGSSDTHVFTERSDHVTSKCWRQRSAERPALTRRWRGGLSRKRERRGAERVE